MLLKNIKVRPVRKDEETRFKDLLARYHYLGFVPKIGETLWYVATIEETWLCILSFSVSALKLKRRDDWIGWGYRRQSGRLKLVVNNNRFLILPPHRYPNLGSRVLSLCLKRLSDDWLELFDHRILLVETFVDPRRFHGTVYRASNWVCIGETEGYRRKRRSYVYTGNRKLIFVKELHRGARRLLSQHRLDEEFITREIMTIKAEHMKALPDCFSNISDPRRSAGKRHSLKTILAISTAAILCGMEGYKGIWDWAKSLSQRARERFECRIENGQYVIPSEYVIRNVLMRVDPDQLDQSFQRWNETYAVEDETLAIDGKTMKAAIDSDGKQVHIMSAVGHHTKVCYTQKKLVRCQ
jgi:hypothetical protein